MKTITSKLAALLLMLVGTVAANAETKVYLDDINIAAGEQAVVGINLDNADETNLIGFTLNITLPEGLSMVEDEDGNYFTKTERLTRYHSLGEAARPDLGANTYRVNVNSTSKAKIKGTSGALLTFTVEADENIHNSYIKAWDITLTKPAGAGQYDDIPVADSQSNVKMAERLDGEVSFFATESEYSVKPGDEFTVEVNISNTARLASFQCYVNLPEGLEFVENEDGLLAGLTENLPENIDLSIGADNAAEGELYVALSSFTNELLPDEGVLFNFIVKATESLPASSEIVVNKFGVGNLAAKFFELDDVVTITVVNEVSTGINAAKATVAGAEYYNVNGVRVAAPQKGINIVKMANGEVRKVNF